MSRGYSQLDHAGHKVAHAKSVSRAFLACSLATGIDRPIGLPTNQALSPETYSTNCFKQRSFHRFPLEATMGKGRKRRSGLRTKYEKFSTGRVNFAEWRAREGRVKWICWEFGKLVSNSFFFRFIFRFRCSPVTWLHSKPSRFVHLLASGVASRIPLIRHSKSR